MIYGIGTDILNMNRVKVLSEDFSDSFFRIIFTQREYEQAISSPQPLVSFCKKFAAKEAVYKALNTKDAFCEPDFAAIEILTDPATGVPYAGFHGKLRSYADALRLRMHVSISSDTDYITAFAVSETESIQSP